MNKIFLIERNDDIDYDEFIGFVVVALSEKIALEIVNKHGWGDANPKKSDLVISEIGISHNLEEQIILDSFRAG